MLRDHLINNSILNGFFRRQDEIPVGVNVDFFW